MTLFSSPPVTAAMIITRSHNSSTLGAPSLATSTLAAVLGAEYLELPVGLSADGHPIVFRPLTLEGSTDVEQVFPEKKRTDGSYYPIDFTLDQLRRLRLRQAPIGKSPALGDAIATLTEHLALMRRLETLLDRPLGIVFELRTPWFYRQEGRDLSTSLLTTVREAGYAWPKDKIYLQCFDPEELQLLQRQLFPELSYSLPLIQMVGSNDGHETKHKNSLGTLEPYSYDWLFTNTGLKVVASYAMALALPAPTIADPTGHALPLPPGYIDEAHRQGLLLLALASASGEPVEDAKTLVNQLLGPDKADGLYIDNPIAAQRALSPPSQIPSPGPAPASEQEEKAAEATIETMANGPSEKPAQDDLPPFFKNLQLSRPLLPDNPEDAAENPPSQ